MKAARTPAGKGAEPARGRSGGAAPPTLASGIGNQALQQHVNGGLLRAKIAVGAIDDPAEAEANRIAGRIVAGPPAPCHSGGCPSGRGEAGVIRHKPVGSGAASARAEAFGSRAGRVLAPGLRSYYEPHLGIPLAAVRVHDDAATAATAREIGARAFTVGTDVGFAAEAFAPHTTSGAQLLAHELAHVAQGGELIRRQPTNGAGSNHPGSSPVNAPRQPAAQQRAGADAAVPGSVTINFLSNAPWYAFAEEDATPQAIAFELYGLEVPSLIEKTPLFGGFAVQANLLRPAYRARFDALLEICFKKDVEQVESILFDSTGLAHWSELVEIIRGWSRLHDVSRDGGESWFDAFLGRLDADYTYYDYGVTTGSKTSFLDSLFAIGGNDVGALFALVSQNSRRFGLYHPPEALLTNPKEAAAAPNPALVKRAAELVLERLQGLTSGAESGAITSILTGMPPAGQAAVLREIMSRFDETDWTGIFGRYGERRPVGMLYWLFEDLTKENRRTLADSLVRNSVLQKDAADALVDGRGFVAQFLPYTTDAAIDATQFWADQYEKSSGAEAGFYGFMGGLSVLATPKVIDQTALVLGTAGVGAEFAPLIAARAPTLAAGLTISGATFAGFQAGVAIGRLIDGRDANGRPLEDSGRAALALIAISNILFAAAGVLSLRAPTAAADTGIVRVPPGDLAPPEPGAGTGQGSSAPTVNMRLISFDPESGEMIVAAQDPATGRYAVARLNSRTGAGQVIGPEGEVVPIENFKLSSARPALPAASDPAPAPTPAGTSSLPPSPATARSLSPGAAPAPALPAGARPPLPLPAGPPAPLILPGPRYHTLAEILPDPTRGFVVPEIERAYQAYLARIRPPEVPAPREEWVRLTRYGPRADLVRWLGPNFPTTEGEPVYIRLASIARPPTLTDARLADLLGQLEAEPAALYDRYNPARAAGPSPDEINLANFNILKGNVGEILARPIRSGIVADIQTRFPGAETFDGVRMRLPGPDGTLGPPRLFGDGVVSETIGKNLVVRGVVETKAGTTGGQAATEQVFEWNEGRIEPGAQMVLPDGRSFTYDPEGIIRNPDGSAPPRVIFLLAAGRHLISPAGAEALGEGSSMGIGPEVRRYALPATAEEINFITRLQAERLAAPAAPAPAPPKTSTP